MKTQIIKNLLSDEDMLRISELVSEELGKRPINRQPNPSRETDTGDTTNIIENYGRLEMKYINLPEDIVQKLYSIVKNTSGEDFPGLGFSFVIYAEYSKDYGKNPKLDPHFDISDAHTIILDYQLDSNTSWDICVESDTFNIENNSGLLFEPEDNIHYRPIKNFKDGEFIKMLFIRFVTGKDVVTLTQEKSGRLGQKQKEYSNLQMINASQDTN
jgi:hypothetical protein